MPGTQRDPAANVPGTAPAVDQVKTPDEEAAVTPDEGSVMLSIKTPFVDSFVGNVDGKSQTVGPGPTEFPASVAEELVKQAKDSGVKLARKGQ